MTSILSTSGFSTTDYTNWPTFSQAMLVLLMFVGGCSGSTAGSIKCGRILLLRCAAPAVPAPPFPSPVGPGGPADGKLIEEPALRSVFFLRSLLFPPAGNRLFGGQPGRVFHDHHLHRHLRCLEQCRPCLDGVGPVSNFAALSSCSKNGPLPVYVGGTIGDLPHSPATATFHLETRLTVSPPGICSMNYKLMLRTLGRTCSWRPCACCCP